MKDIPALALGGGVKRIDGAWGYTLWGHGTVAVRIEWRNAKGKPKSTIVSSPDPVALAASIEKARAGAASGLRVGAPSSVRNDPVVVRGDAVGGETSEEEEEVDARQRRRE